MSEFYDIVSAPIGMGRIYTMNECATLAEAVDVSRKLLARSPSFERLEIELDGRVVAVVGPGAEFAFLDKRTVHLGWESNPAHRIDR